MTPEELHARAMAIKAEMVGKAEAGDEEAKRWLREVYPEEFPSSGPRAVNKAVPPPHWQEREPGEEG